MSFDLMVFDPTDAPRLREAFLHWMHSGTGLAGHDYASPAQLRGPLRLFYDRLYPIFPPRHDQTHPGPACADYSFAEGFIYLSFLREAADPAYGTVIRLAHDTGAGFFNAASDWGEILHDRAQFAPYLAR